MEPSLKRADALAVHVRGLPVGLDRPSEEGPRRPFEAFTAVVNGIGMGMVLEGQLEIAGVKDGQIVYRSKLYGRD